MNTEERKAQITAEFEEQFGRAPQIWSRAPGRVDLMGSHTDYNMGYVMTMTVDRDTWIAASQRDDGKVRIRSMNIKGKSKFSLHKKIKHDQRVPWSNYVRGMAVVMQQAGYELQGFDGLIHSTVPFGSGLSSSAAIEMATAVTFQQLGGFELDPVDMAKLGQQAENEFVGVSTGILDQYSSVLGQAGSAIQLDCRHLAHEMVPIADGLQVVICDTRAERNLIGSEYDDRRAQCEAGVQILQQHYPKVQALRDVTLVQFTAHESKMPELVAKRCRFIIEENQRVLDLAVALPQGDSGALNQLFADSYIGARDLFEIGAPSMSAMMRAMQSAPGVVAARQAGAGFGGCMVALVKDDCVAEFSAYVQTTYTDDTGIEPRIFAVSAAAGAGVLEKTLEI
ncbi:galactokinase [Candidatus Leptofilum sp.]|uniref:galactokinase n=1 Tax=Candidatus Leptofilum sp. TaxID=3241576 RepID=UPI003B5C4BDE